MLRINLPFVDGVNLREFLRQRLLDMDTALNTVQLDHEPGKLTSQTKKEVESMHSKMEAA